MNDRVFIIGCGAVGASLAGAISQTGLRISGVFDLREDRSTELALQIGGSAHFGALPEITAHARIVIVAVPDGSIGDVAARAAADGICSRDQVWLHCSGQFGADALAPLDDLVAGTGTLHPALVFPPGAVREIPFGTHFAVDGNNRAVAAAQELAELLRGSSVVVPAGARPGYHAATVIASNYVVTLMAEARKILEAQGMDADVAQSLLTNLTSSAVEAASARGIEASLSGPVRRGDTDTVERHIDALSSLPKTGELYRFLGARTIDLVRSLAELDPEKIREMENKLGSKPST